MLTGVLRNVVRVASIMAVCSLATGVSNFHEEPVSASVCVLMIFLGLHTEWETYQAHKKKQERT